MIVYMFYSERSPHPCAFMFVHSVHVIQFIIIGDQLQHAIHCEELYPQSGQNSQGWEERKVHAYCHV